MATWQLQTAKAKLSELLRAVREEGPQVISVRGKEEYVVMRKQDVSEATAKPEISPSSKSIWDLFEPLRRVGFGDDLDEALHSVREDSATFDRDE